MALYDSLRPFTILLSASLSVVLRVVVILYTSMIHVGLSVLVTY